MTSRAATGDPAGDTFLTRLRAATPIILTAVGARAAVVACYVVAPSRWSSIGVGDLRLYGEWASQIVATRAAPDDVTWMYPPGAVGVVLGAHLVPVPYTYSAVVLTALLDAALLALLLTRGRHPAGARGWAVLPPLLGLVAWSRLDMVPVAATAGALLLATTRPRLSGVLAAVGTAVKAWPVLLGLLLWRDRRWLTWAVGSGLLVAVTVTLGLRGAWDFVPRLVGRGIQIESVLATPWLLGQVLGHQVAGDRTNGTYEIEGPGVVGLATVSSLLILVAVAIAWWASRRWPPATRWWVMSLALLTASPLLSTQFLLWVAGSTVVAASLPGRDGSPARRALPAVALITLLTQLGFPVTWDSLTQGGIVGAAVVSGRNLLLVTLTVAVVTVLARRLPTAGGSGPLPSRRSRPAALAGSSPTAATSTPASLVDVRDAPAEPSPAGR